ncbi:acetyl-CoA synthetase-like protein [Cylindrobasidium torrendii FP15055 ss-10]|uniref:Acetyl-CoA synthetase-like protein n=1 Tax=Cylindrobasidium torrendii FP15055 ss-10 TaxID=1314674 RepID=A0A0D7BV94_9AGAR|nr:acetyl-CoA synthetase-like protein [Cylindrobasidium torrendii FP15055 ss-10]
MPSIFSPWPQPPPPLDGNAHLAAFYRPEHQKALWKDGDFTLYVDLQNGQRLSYKGFLEAVANTRRSLSSSGFLQGDIIGLMSDNCLEFPILFHACLSLGVPVALIPPYLTPRELAHCLGTVMITKVFVDTQSRQHDWPNYIDLYTITATDGYTSLSEVMSRPASSNASNEVVHTKKDDIAYLMFSSGTSGLPKAIKVSHGNISYSIEQMLITARAAARVNPPRKVSTPEGIPLVLAFLPMCHTYALHTYCIRAGLTPKTFVIQRKWDLSDALRAIPKYGITDVNFVPSLAAQLVTHPDQNAVREALQSVRVSAAGGAYFPIDLKRRLQRLMPQAYLAEGYGLSEATITAINQPPPGTLGGYKSIPGSCGVLFPGLHARLIDDAGNDVPQGTIGELLLSGPNIVQGYYGDSEEVQRANSSTFHVDGGWMRTGDRFSIDAAGNFFFADRVKDTLKVSGLQVSPLEIENVLLAHPEGLAVEAAVAGVRGGRTEDERVPRAWVVLSERGHALGHDTVVAELVGWCQSQLSKYKWLRGGLEIVTHVPKNPTGKTLRRELVAKYEARNLAAHAKL